MRRTTFFRILRNLSKTNKQADFTELPTKEYLVPFSLSRKKQQKWYELFNASNENVYIPFTYFIKGGAIMLFDVLDELNLSVKNLFHIKSSRALRKGFYWKENEQYKLIYGLNDVLKVKGGICVVTKMRMLDQDNREVISKKNAFLLKVSDQDIAAFDQSSHQPRHDADEFESMARVSKIHQNDRDCQKVGLDIFPKLGGQYGNLSGDLNPLHTNRFLAKLNGAPNAFIQGYCLFNYVIKALADDASREYQKISMNFCRPVFEDQKAHLLLLGDRYQVVDGKNKLLAYGNLGLS